MGPAFRRPPPHPRRRSDSSLKLGTTTVIGGIRRRAYYFRRCKKIPASDIESLPNEVLIEILARLSADEICEKARFVCRSWYRIIHSDAFINAHRANSNWGILLTNLYRKEHPLFLGSGVRQGRIEISKLYEECFSPFPASCNGLVVSMDSPTSYTINFVNLATKQTFISPPLFPCSHSFCTFGIAYAAASMEYKVVRTYTFDLTQASCHILSAGVDNIWRCVGVDHLSYGAKKLLLQLRDPLITQGFMHWTWKWGGTRVLTLNAETEVFTESYVPLFPHPVDDDGYARRRSVYYLSTGRHLSLLFACRDWVWEVWEMEGGSGEWRKLLPNIDLEAHKRRLPHQSHGLLEPLGWVEYPVILALFCGSTCIVYNLDTDEIDSIELPQKCRNYKAVVHRNTLEWLS